MSVSSSQLIDQLYAAVQTPALLLDAYDGVAKQGGGFGVHYLCMDAHLRSVTQSEVSHPQLADAQSEYANHYVSVDSRVPWMTGGLAGEWRPDQFQFDTRRAERLEIYHDFLRPAGVRRMAAVRLDSGHTGQQQMLSIARAHDAGDFTAEELRRLSLFSPHLVRAAQLREKLDRVQAELAAAQGALAPLPYGTLWLTPAGGVTWISPSAQALLAASDGLGLRQDHLRCANTTLDTRLKQALALATRASGREGSWLRVPRAASPAPWLLSLIPGDLPSHCGGHGGGQAQVLAILQDSAGPALPPARQLQQLYGLTPAEARLALGLLQDQSPADYAQQQGLSLATVRTQMRSLFSKTGTRRQAELLRQLSLPLAAAAMGPGPAG